MPRARKKDKFYLYAPKKSGYWKDKRLMGVNGPFEGTVQDLLDFLEEKGVSPSDVVLPPQFTAYAIAKRG